MIAQPRLASAVMLLRDRVAEQGIEVFMVRRVIQSDFMPDVYVFPGGSVSADDQAAETAEGVCMPVASTPADPEGQTILGSGTRAAAIRELFEEAGVLLAYHLTQPATLHSRGYPSDRLDEGSYDDEEILAIPEKDIARFAAYRDAFNSRRGSLIELARAENLKLATDRLNYCAHWITPEGMPKRFDTYFFLTTAPAEQQAAHDKLETSAGVWISPAEALARFELDEFPLVFATIYQLRELAAFGSVKEALESTATQLVLTHMPVLAQQEGKARVHLPEDESNAWDVPGHMTKM